MSEQLTRELTESGDPRHEGPSFDFDTVPYLGGAPKHPDAEAAARKKKGK